MTPINPVGPPQPTPPAVLAAIDAIAAHLRATNRTEAVVSHTGGASFHLPPGPLERLGQYGDALIAERNAADAARHHLRVVLSWVDAMLHAGRAGQAVMPGMSLEQKGAYILLREWLDGTVPGGDAR